MSDEHRDELAEAARNRGLKLVRSRVRTPTKRRFGKVGLTDKAGKPIFGMDDKGPTAKPEDVEEYLRKLGAKDWGASLDVAAPQRKRTTRKPAREPANDRQPERKPAPPPPPPKPKIRDAKNSDAPRLVELIALLGHDIDEKAVRKNLSKLKKASELPLVATLDKNVVGLIGRHAMVTIHRPAPVGRITVLVVAEEARRQNIGRLLVDAVERWCRDKAFELIEVTSNDRLIEAHAFYRRLGYERTSIRLFKKLS